METWIDCMKPIIMHDARVKVENVSVTKCVFLHLDENFTWLVLKQKQQFY